MSVSSSQSDESEPHDPCSQLSVDEYDITTDVSDTDMEDAEQDEDEDELNLWNKEFNDNAEEFESHPDAIKEDFGITITSSALEIFQKFLTEELVLEICTESKRYADQNNIGLFQPLDLPEFWRFIAVHLTMGIVKKPSIKDYWTVNPITKTPFFSQTMARDRYMLLLRCLHFVNNEAIPVNNTDRFIKLGSLMKNLVYNWKSAVHPGEYLCLDESLVPFKGKLSFKQYNPKKRARFGVKLFVLGDAATKLILDILPYQGKATKLSNPLDVKQLGFGGAAVLTMLEPYYNASHRVVIDNYFNSPKLAMELRRKKTYILGTVQKRRQGMPKGFNMNRKLKKGDVKTFSNDDILVERWCDRRDVFMLNTFLPHVMIDAETEKQSIETWISYDLQQQNGSHR